MDGLPTPNECIRLLNECGCSQEVIRHCQAVRDVAVRIAKRAHADIKLVETGALLHDIGRSKTQGLTHGIIGAQIAREKNLPESIVNIIERHLGAGIPKEEAVLLGLPSRNFLPMTLEEKIVAHADNLIDGDRQQMIEAEVEKALKKGKKELAQRLVLLHKELSNICKIDLNYI
jgi:tRNA (cytidine56-2'-O)-methyltransferase